jgi:hypothetical protein
MEAADRVVPYIALSYCWGEIGHNGKTTKENIASNMQRLDIKNLPQTIQDAIQFTWLLGVEYL